MSIFDRIAEKPSNLIEGTNMSLLDGDTAVDNDTGDKYRLASVDTAEIDRYPNLAYEILPCLEHALFIGVQVIHLIKGFQ